MRPLLYPGLYFALLILQIFQLSAQEQIADSTMKLPLPIECEIVKIDSAGNHYVIYAKQITKEDKPEKYKIVSEKDSTVCQNIVVGQYYKLTLYQYPNSMGHVTHQIFYGGATIPIYGWGDGLYSTLEIKGLCYNPDYIFDVILKRKEGMKQESLKFKNKRGKKKYYDKLSKDLDEKIGKDRYYEENPLIEWE